MRVDVSIEVGLLQEGMPVEERSATQRPVSLACPSGAFGKIFSGDAGSLTVCELISVTAYGNDEAGLRLSRQC